MRISDWSSDVCSSDLAAGELKFASRIEMALGVVIGAVTFSGSLIAFAKLQALMSGNPIVFPGQHPLNALIGAVIVALIVWFCATPEPSVFWLMTEIGRT